MRSPEVSESVQGPYHFVYVEHKGGYQEFREKLKHVQSLVIGSAIRDFIPAAIYFDDPKAVEEGMLRSWMGALLSKADYDKLEGLAGKGGIRRVTISPQNYVRTTFPKTTFISIYLGIIKCYPAMEAYAKENNYSPYEYRETGYENSFTMEIYRAGSIEYLMTIN